jgi:hypothetical protein
VVDPAGVQTSSIAFAKPGDVLTFVGVKVHRLPSGATFDLSAREPHGASTFVTGH